MTMRYRNMSRYAGDEGGTTAVEFAIIAPLIAMLLVGIPSLALMLFAIGSMHFAVEDAARCASARPTQCSNQAAIITYAQSRYSGVLATPVFSHVVAACGNKVTATVTFTFDVGMYKQSVPLSATSCFPPDFT